MDVVVCPERCRPVPVREFLAISVVLALSASAGRSDEAVSRSADIPTITVKIRVEDPNGNPIPDAVVTGRGMRTKAERGSWYGWIPERHGEPATGMSNAEGNIELAVPKFVHEKLETGEVDWIVDHPDYVKADLDLRVGDDPGVVKLAHGRRIIANAVDRDTEEPIDQDLYAQISGDSWYDEWKSLNGGKIMSPTVSCDRPLLRLIQLPNNGVALFSDVIDLDSYARLRRTVVRDIPLSPGTRVKGKVIEDVPRPIANGYVAVTSVLHTGIKDRKRQLTWSHWVPIEPNGSFLVESLPRDTIGQFIAVCDGWVSAPTLLECFDKVGLGELRGQRSAQLVTPHLINLSGDEVECVLPMETTISCRVKVQKADGMPVRDAQVSMWPNQKWYGGGSQWTGSALRRDLMLKLTPAERVLMLEWSDRSQEFQMQKGVAKFPSDRYQQTTDEHGIAIIRQLPCGTEDQPRNTTVHVQHDEFEQRPANNRRADSVELIRGQIAEITVTMDPKGTTVLGE